MSNSNPEKNMQKALFAPEDQGPALTEYLLILARYQKMILKVIGVAFVVALICFFMWPRTFTATASLLPPISQDVSSTLMSSGFSDLAALAGLEMGSGTGDFYLGILKSRTVADRIIDEYDLMEVYGESTRFETYESLEEHVVIATEASEGIIVINVDDNDPERAAAIANAYVEALMDLNVKLKLTEAGRRRLFLENELKKTQKSLFQAEENLKQFQQEHDLIKMDDQARVMIETAAELRAQLIANEVQLAALRSYQTNENIQVKEIRKRIKQIRTELTKLEVTSETANPTDDGMFIPSSQASEIAFSYGRLLREVKSQEAVFSGLTQQYELARIEEAKEGSSVQTLDQAVPPDKHSKPRLLMFILFPTFLAGFCACSFALLKEFFARLDPEERTRWEEVKQQFTLNVSRFRN
jgi:tyrosine-protein kinase Etk/Wzc